MKPPKVFHLTQILLILLALTSSVQAFYSPTTGRFLSRDPIGEKGGPNYYIFAKNSPVSSFDAYGMVTVSFTSPDPRTIVPAEAEQNNRVASGTEYVNKVCSCECFCPDKEMGDFFIRCIISFSAKIYLSASELGLNGATWQTIYGHEQQHVVSRIALVERDVVIPARGRHNDGFANLSLCRQTRRPEEKTICDQFKDRLNPEVFPPHEGEQIGENGAPPGSPGEGQPRPPLDGTNADILQKLRFLDDSGYGL